MDVLGRHELQRRHRIDMLGRGCPYLSAFEGIAKELDERAIAFHGYERNHANLLYRCRLSLVDMS